ncbi:hypothetical protein N826_27130 [Skermanella aerolata KACC 11604]|nr:hypothetical protein N826_27130 [Skermanella aerolata KACC 11604]
MFIQIDLYVAYCFQWREIYFIRDLLLPIQFSSYLKSDLDFH